MSSNATYGEVTIGATASVLLVGRGQRGSALIRNTHATQSLYLGDDANVTVAGATGGFPLLAGESVRLDNFTGNIWAIASGAGTTVRYFEQ